MTDVVGEFVALHVHDRIATLTLSRPPTNALTRQLNREIEAGARALTGRDDVTSVILYGGHEVFSAGADLPERRTLTAAEDRLADEAAARAVAAVAAITRPTVAALTGYALGGGLTLALAADWRTSGDNVRLGATEILDGLAPTDAATARLTRAVGESAAKDLVFSGRFVGADEARAIGLVDELVAPDHVYDAALRWAGRFADSPPAALAAAKATFALG
ncbi:enoyl-CoA hydratase-related protein [Mycolicibacterium sediminis]|uniref:Putative enoyl-CoA hydratase echA17 n=1 Tax=Mycolicibacterium sediminis TaxID=1286180 RepID=A0A7I7QRZ6_9MYCO|nr:enoyl-CoA hydratase-related protein [Mycolicibacterium sediminis]BBY29169.1 putative enoyl-CoA hydratase echA17 [Mycolicibacterium sediminis]